MCVCAYVVENLFERVSLFFVLILLFVCAENSFFWVCVSILIIFCCIHTNTGWFVSFHFISFHYISDVDHYCFACYKNVGFSSHFIAIWMGETCTQWIRPAGFMYTFFFHFFVQFKLCGSDVKNGQQFFFLWWSITK